MKEKEEESSCSAIMDGFITGIQFALASRDEIVSNFLFCLSLSCPVTWCGLLFHLIGQDQNCAMKV